MNCDFDDNEVYLHKYKLHVRDKKRFRRIVEMKYGTLFNSMCNKLWDKFCRG